MYGLDQKIVWICFRPCESLRDELTDAYNNESDVQLKPKIAHALSLCHKRPSLLLLTIALQDPDLTDKQRNKVWKEIIDRWTHNQHEFIDKNTLRDCLKALSQRFSDTKARSQLISQFLFRSGFDIGERFSENSFLRKFNFSKIASHINLNRETLILKSF